MTPALDPLSPPSGILPWRHALLALAVVAVWGTNFVVIKLALPWLPPLLFCALRFAFAAAPLLWLGRRPRPPWRFIVAYAMFVGVGQFSLMFVAVGTHITPGLASLVIQMQAFFTLGLSSWLLAERVRPVQWLALTVAAAGIGWIAVHTDSGTTVVGVLMILGAAMLWACGNLVNKRVGKVDMLGYMAWSSLCAAPVLFALSWVYEGPRAIGAALLAAPPAVWGAVLWQAWANVLFGYGAWGWLLARHPAATVVPMSLLVPLFGMSASLWWLGEPLPAWKLVGAGLVISGLAINLFGPWVRSRWDALGVAA